MKRSSFLYIDRLVRLLIALGVLLSSAGAATFRAALVSKRGYSSFHKITIKHILGAVANPPTGQIWRVYYHANGQPIAMREVSNQGANNALTFLHQDHLGSTSLTTNSSGAVVSRQTYYPYGELRWGTGVAPTTIGYTGQHRDTGVGSLMFYDSRYYSPILARFISADTLVPGAYNPQALNRYGYSFSNPLIYIDPSGHEPCETGTGLYCNGGHRYSSDNSDELDWSWEYELYDENDDPSTCRGLQNVGCTPPIPQLDPFYFLTDLIDEVVEIPTSLGYDLASTQENDDEGNSSSGSSSGSSVPNAPFGPKGDKDSPILRLVEKLKSQYNRGAPWYKDVYDWGQGTKGVERANSELSVDKVKKMMGELKAAGMDPREVTSQWAQAYLKESLLYEVQVTTPYDRYQYLVRILNIMDSIR